MALPSNHRWIALGNLLVRKEKRASLAAPETTLDEVIEVAKQRLAEGKQYREYSNQTRLMWFGSFGDNDAYHLFLAENGDKNTSGVSFIDFDTRTSRDVPKEENEGGHFTGHVAIAKQANATGGHLILVERVPGIYLGSIKNHFAWLCSDDQLLKPYKDEAGKDKIARAVFEIDGHQSSTIRDALKTGSLQDIEFIQSVEEHDDGLDEEPIIKDIVHQAKWEVKQKVSEDEAASVFGKMRGYFRDKFRKGDGDAHMFVRIKTAAGQIKRTEIPDSEEAVLEQAFVHNEFINDFKEPLAQRHEGLRDDVVKKILAIPAKLEKAAETDEDA